MSHEFHNKNRSGKAGDYLTYKELSCQCEYDHCLMLVTYTPSILSFNNTRHNYGKPIRITSGHRCPRHNAAVNGVKLSFHMRGQAHDLAPLLGLVSDDDRKAELKLLEAIARKHYDVVLPYYDKGFVHCHNLGE